MRVCTFVILTMLAAVSWRMGLAAGVEGDGARVRDNILALDRIRSGVVAASKTRQQNPDEDRIFLAFLDERIREECEALAGMKVAVAGLPCPALVPRFPQNGAQTSAEQVAALESELQTALGEFDEMLLAEQERIAQRQQDAGSGGGSAASGAGHGTNAGGQGDGKGIDAGQKGGRLEKGQAALNDSAPGREERPAAATGRAKQASTLANGSRSGRDRLATDDDIVARQLREAAEREKDPELKKKLWQEYRKYKEGR